MIVLLQQLFVEDQPPLCLQSCIVYHVERALVREVLGEVGARWLPWLQQVEVFVQGRDQLGAEVGPVLFLLRILVNYLLEPQKFA